MAPSPAPPAPPATTARSPRGAAGATALAAVGLVGFAGAAWWLGRPPEARAPATAPADATTSAAPGPAGAVHAGPRFTEVAAASGIRFRHERPVLDPKLDNMAPILTHIGGASVAVVDFDGDGWVDLYATSSRFDTSNALFRNRGDGTFEDVAAAAGLADLNRAGEGVCMGSVWADFDGDGLEDVFVYRWGRQALFRNLGGGRFEDVTARAGVGVWMNSNGAIWLDHDRDGLLDLYVTGYLRSDIDLWNLKSTVIMQESFEFARNGGKNLLFRNVGGGRFEDVTDATGLGSTRWTLAAASADFDGNGWPDVYLANDYGPEELYLNRGEGRFDLETRAGLRDDSKSGMCVALGDVWNRARTDVFVTNISERGYLLQGNNLRLNRLAEEGRFLQAAEEIVADCGWAWGAQFADFDLDGWADLFVANGYISANPDRNYWYGMSKVAMGSGGIMQDARNWPAIGDLSLSGYQRSRVLWNRSGSMRDVAEAAGVTDRLDGRAVAVADLWNRGRADVIVANQGGPLLVYRNESPAGNRSLRLRIVGRGGNRSAIGAEVVVEAGGRRQRQVVTAGLGYSAQNDRRLLFGLGGAARADRVHVRWLSGEERVLEGLAADVLHVVEEAPAR